MHSPRNFTLHQVCRTPKYSSSVSFALQYWCMNNQPRPWGTSQTEYYFVCLHGWYTCISCPHVTVAGDTVCMDCHFEVVFAQQFVATERKPIATSGPSSKWDYSVPLCSWELNAVYPPDRGYWATPQKGCCYYQLICLCSQYLPSEPCFSFFTFFLYFHFVPLSLFSPYFRLNTYSTSFMYFSVFLFFWSFLPLVSLFSILFLTFVCFSIYPSIHPSVDPSVCLSICLSVSLSICLSLSVCPSVCLSTRPFPRLFSLSFPLSCSPSLSSPLMLA